MSSCGSFNYPLCNADAISEPSIQTLHTRKRKNPYTPWYVPATKHHRTACFLYGPQNETYFTMQVSHGGDLVDRPGKSYNRSRVTIFESMNVNRMDLHELFLISRDLGYTTIGKWYYMDEDPAASLDLVPLRTEDDVASFCQRVRFNNFQNVEKLLVEHGEPSEFDFLPKDVMEYGEKRIEKIVTLLLLDNPRATVEEGVERVYWVTCLHVSKEKVKTVIDQARMTLGLSR